MLLISEDQSHDEVISSLVYYILFICALFQTHKLVHRCFSKNHAYTNNSLFMIYLQVNPSDVIILEGILIFHDPRVRDLMNMKVFVDAGLSHTDPATLI